MPGGTDSAAAEAEVSAEDVPKIAGTVGDSLGARLGLSVGNAEGLIVGETEGVAVGLTVGAELGIRVGDAVGHKVPLPTAWVAASSYPANGSVQSKHAVATSAAWSIGSVKETRTTTEPGETEMKSGVVVSPVTSATFWRKMASNSEVSPVGKSVLKSMS